MVKTSCSQFRGHELGPQLRNMLQGMIKRKKKNKIYIYICTYYVYFKTFTFKEVEHDPPTS